ncbi:hypothetical protein [Helicobacter sp. MIT 11-5569]|uniref:hypothetical protein n=1 Tax=Helicobacter sp. MIT 11-5569 TaxID=1548151 RepID=UPI000A48DADF|nr:hypothetical protein [Helicobacter sp. MIT 11-5569]
MSVALSVLALAGLTGAYIGLKKKDPQMSISHCFLDKLAYPITNLLMITTAIAFF